ncbi:hypothetical protein At1g04090-like [Euphorbia lathyris]|uniref:hypothetical protein At1g04090-like n=1 Tax=Euphorbia lathyris TaxID=212925 RepID=UPI00331350CB
MFGCECFVWNTTPNLLPSEPDIFSLPSPLPPWPPGQGFASGTINLGEIEVVKISRFELIWTLDLSQDIKKSVSFYRPLSLPEGCYSFGHYCQINNQPFRGFLLAAREVTLSTTEAASLPALQKPIDYTLIWSSYDGFEDDCAKCGYFWLPKPPEGYKSLGYFVTNSPHKPDLDEVRCVRADLTEECQAYRRILHLHSEIFPFQVWSIRPINRGMLGRGVSVGTFFCSSYWTSGEGLGIVCLKNSNPQLHGMPNLEQIHKLIEHYGPTVFFHPDETYLPSSVSWFFKNGALLYKAGDSKGEPIDGNGSNLPAGGRSDGQFWIDLPSDDRRDTVKGGNLESAKLYIHVKPAEGGSFTDIVMWVFCPFNGPARIKLGPVNLALGKIGQHIGDWEHFTLRICNFTGELWSLYFSQHSGGKWVDAYDLEYIEGNKPIVYSSKSGHASYPHAGMYLQGSAKVGIGIRNDACRSKLLVDSSRQYEIVAAEYLGGNIDIIEPNWLQFMRVWGPKIVYNSRNEVDKIVNRLPLRARNSVENIVYKLPIELYGEEGPTGPKEKNNWVGDERG